MKRNNNADTKSEDRIFRLRILEAGHILDRLLIEAMVKSRMELEKIRDKVEGMSKARVFHLQLEHAKEVGEL